jgi:hypothetical protein
MNIEHRPWMLETAYDFIRAARLLWENKLGSPAMVNVAVGLEILFKSFNATVDGSSGGIGEQYRIAGKPTHDLLALFDAIPQPIRQHLGLQRYRDYFEGRMAELFVSARYPYERDGMASSGSAIIEVAEEICDRVIREYLESGCTDPWIAAFANR